MSAHLPFAGPKGEDGVTPTHVARRGRAVHLQLESTQFGTTYVNGGVYEGELVSEMSHGLGVLYSEDGNIYLGHFHEDCIDGEGVLLTGDSGEYCVGEFRRGAMHQCVRVGADGALKTVCEAGKRVLETERDKAVHVQWAQRRLVTIVSGVLRSRARHLLRHTTAPSRLLMPARFLPTPSPSPPTNDDEASDEEATGIDTAGVFGRPSRRVTPPHSRTTRAPRSTTVPGELCNASFASNFAATTMLMANAGASADKLAMTTTGPTAPVLTGVTADYGNASGSSGGALFAYTAPGISENFSAARFWRYLFVFLFPFCSLPGTPFACCRVTTLDVERVFVVSGAALRVDFDSPSLSLYLVALAMGCHITAIVLVACRVRLGPVHSGSLTLAEIVLPCILWFVLAMFCASYNSYLRVPHLLERVDRRMTSHLSALAGSVVDAKAHVCIYTWHEHGYSRVRNAHYRYRWLGASVVLGAAVALAAPATRAGFHHPWFGRGRFSLAAGLLAFAATVLLAATLSYYVVKVIDMQREIHAKMRVLTDLAFLEQRSIANPSRLMTTVFDVGKRLDVRNVLEGFPGWYAVRTIVLYVSTSGNHYARSAAMSVFVLTMFCAALVAVGDVLYAWSHGLLQGTRYYNTAHSYGLFVFVMYGLLLARYLAVCRLTYGEEARQLYVMDVANLYHRIRLRDATASETIALCRRMAAEHDARPTFFGKSMHPIFVSFLLLMNVCALAAICIQLAMVIYY